LPYASVNKHAPLEMIHWIISFALGANGAHPAGVTLIVESSALTISQFPFVNRNYKSICIAEGTR